MEKLSRIRGAPPRDYLQNSFQLREDDNIDVEVFELLMQNKEFRERVQHSISGQVPQNEHSINARRINQLTNVSGQESLYKNYEALSYSEKPRKPSFRGAQKTEDSFLSPEWGRESVRLPKISNQKTVDLDASVLSKRSKKKTTKKY